MKRLKNAAKTICGIKYYPFMILTDVNKGIYEYYLINRIPLLNKTIPNQKIWRGERTMILNKVTLSAMWLLYSLVIIPICLIIAIAYPFVAYGEGCKNFVTDSVWITNVRFFGWVNIFLIFSLITALILK